MSEVSLIPCIRLASIARHPDSIIQGYHGKGYELRARRTWPLYPARTQAALVEAPLDPPSWFPSSISEWTSGDWSSKAACVIEGNSFLIGNHADELTVSPCPCPEVRGHTDSKCIAMAPPSIPITRHTSAASLTTLLPTHMGRSIHIVQFQTPTTPPFTPRKL